MAAAGATPEAIAIAVEAIETVTNCVTQSVTQRSANAERQARFRAKKREAEYKNNAERNDQSNAERNGKNHKSVTPSHPPKNIYQTPQIPLDGFSDENPSPAPEALQVSVKPEHVQEAWNALADRTGLPKIKKLEGTRLRQTNSLIRRATIDDITEAIAAIERNRWMHGENDRGWRADFDFLLQPKSFTKLIEGSYDRA